MLRPRQHCRFSALSLFTTWLIKTATGSSWIDCIDHSYDAVYTKSDDWVRGGDIGLSACEGYAYNYPGRRSDIDEVDYSWKVDPKDNSGSICPYKQKDARYSDWRQAIHAKPGDEIFLGYMPNGHIVQGEDGVESTWGIYWSGVADVELTKPSDLTRDRLVGGKLSGFDDGNCGKTFDRDGKPSGRAGDYKPCVGTFSIPPTAAPGRYQMVWYWTASSDLGVPEGGAAYTSCFDVIVEDTPASPTQLEETASYMTQNGERCGVEDDNKAPFLANSYNNPPTTQPPPQSTPALVTPLTLLPPPAPSPPVTTVPPPATTVPPPTTTAPPPVTMTPPPETRPPPPTTTSPPPSSAARLASPRAVSSSFPNPLAAVTYNGIGGTGLYGKVTTMQCSGGNTCSQSDFAVSGPIAPFDEDLTLALRGPLHVDAISVFISSDASTWSQASSFSKLTGSSENMVFLNNKGDPLKSGVFDLCNGNSQSYATSDGKTSAAGPSAFSGVLDDGVEINVMSATSCTQTTSCGVTRGVAHEGWKGNNKIFMVKGTMPNTPSGGKNLPAMWLLNGQIVRTAQYGCNCRGMGDAGKWKGGCGEFDVAEALPADPNSLTSTIYSFKGSRGTNGFMPRPVDTPVVFVIILAEQTTTGSTDLGMAQILVMRPEDVDMTTPPSGDLVQQWLAYRTGMRVDFDI